MSNIVAAAAQIQDDDELQARQSQVAGTPTSDNNCKTVPHDTPRIVQLKHTISNLCRRLSRAKQRVTSTAPSASSVKGLNLGHRLPAKRHAALLHALSGLERLLQSDTYNFMNSQVRMSLVQKQSRRWSPKDKQIICYVRLEQLDDSPITLCGVQITPVTSVRNLGVVMDSSLSFLTNVNHVISSSFYQLKRIKCSIKALPFDTVKSSQQLCNQQD